MEMEAQASSTKKFKVLLFPWLATGHISPYLELAKILTKKQDLFQPYLCSTAINLTSIHNTLKNNSWDFPIEFIGLHLPQIPELPPHFHTTKDLPPHLHPTLMDAFQKSQPSFEEILNSLKPDLVIYDSFQPWAAKLASSMNIPCIHFLTSGAATLSFFTHLSPKWGRADKKSSYPFPEIHMSEAELMKILDFPTNHAHDLGYLAYTSIELSTNFFLFNSCKETEGKYMEHVTSLLDKKTLPIGPLVVQEVEGLDSHRHIIEWLESKKPSSVVFVSFGSEYFLSKEEIEEVANGLELSDANFLWPIRFPEKDDTIKESLPQGFLERVENRGLVVKGWAPQARILQHPNTGGFVSHCGWNSVIESFYYGVPVIGVPIQYDQPLNMRLIEGLGVGVEAERYEHGRFDRVNICNAIKKVMVEKDGELIREKARELKEKLKIEREVNINVVLQEFSKVCQERQT